MISFIMISINFTHNLSNFLSLSTYNSTIKIKNEVKSIEVNIDKTNHKSLINPSRENSGTYYLLDIE